jgi:hypothetical protein
MKKPQRKLVIDRQTIRALRNDALATPQGGIAQIGPYFGCSHRISGCSTYVDSRCCEDP